MQLNTQQTLLTRGIHSIGFPPVMDFLAPQSPENKANGGVTPVLALTLPVPMDARLIALRLIALPWFGLVASAAFVQVSFLTFKLF